MKKILVILAMLVSMNVNAQWVQQFYSGEGRLNKIKFVDANTGYVGGETNVSPRSIFLKTTNGGNNWINMNISLSFETWIYDLSFINANTGYICGYSVNIYKTNNGGLNWSTIPLPYYSNQTWNAMKFFDENTGYVAGRYGMREKTTNGGLNWTVLDTAVTHINTIYFFDVNTGIMADASSGLYRTTNGGFNWSYKHQLDSSGSAYSFQSISFANENTGYAIGTTYFKAVLVKTTNKGVDWSIVRTFQNELLTVCALNNSAVYVGGSIPYLLYSSNGGLTWSNQNLPGTLTQPNSIEFINPNIGFTCGQIGSVCKTTNGGVWVNNISTETPTKYSLSQNYPNPFNPTTNIKFSIVNTGEVKLVVYDIMGKEVQTLVNERLQPGTYEAAFDGSSLNSGVYFYKLIIRHGGSSTNTFSETKMMLLIK